MVKAMDLFNEQKERERQKQKIYKKVYEKVEKKIIKSSSMNMYQCWYMIPEFFLNIPLYDMEDCKKYLEMRLKDDGFKVSFYSPTIIVISWG